MNKTQNILAGLGIAGLAFIGGIVTPVSQADVITKISPTEATIKKQVEITQIYNIDIVLKQVHFAKGKYQELQKVRDDLLAEGVLPSENNELPLDE